MKRPRGTAVFLLMFFILAILGVALYACVPQRDLSDVKTDFVHEMVAAVDGVLHRCGIAPNLSAESLNSWVTISALGAGIGLLAFLVQQGRRP